MASPLPNKREIFQRELDINRQLQTVLKKRVEILNYTNDYVLFFSQKEKDLVELDELKIRELELIELIKKEGGKHERHARKRT